MDVVEDPALASIRAIDNRRHPTVLNINENGATVRERYPLDRQTFEREIVFLVELIDALDGFDRRRGP
jgi:hypothetical protein